MMDSETRARLLKYAKNAADKVKYHLRQQPLETIIRMEMENMNQDLLAHVARMEERACLAARRARVLSSSASGWKADCLRLREGIQRECDNVDHTSPEASIRRLRQLIEPTPAEFPVRATTGCWVKLEDENKCNGCWCLTFNKGAHGDWLCVAHNIGIEQKQGMDFVRPESCKQAMQAKTTPNVR